MLELLTRPAAPEDAAALAAVYNQGIEERVATFETRLRTAQDILSWFDGRHPAVVVVQGGQGQGIGRVGMLGVIGGAEAAGFWKLVSRIFVENMVSRALVRSVGFREVGIYEKHGQLEGVWRDVVIVERLIDRNVS